MSDEETVRIVLTPEQRETVRRMSGQIVDSIDISPDKAKTGEGPVRFVWRISQATGIPRQGWLPAEDPTESPPKA